MQITFEIDDAVIKAAAKAGVEKAFGKDARFGEQTPGLSVIAAQTKAWVATQDFLPIIAEVAPDIVRGTVANAVANAIKAEARRQIKSQLTAIVAQSMPKYEVQHGDTEN